jgi:hypothetical protein
MDFHELINTLREPGEDGPPPSIYDDLTQAYSSTAQLAEGASAKATELQTRIQEYESEISRLKSTNYDLLMSSQGDNSGEGEDKNQNHDVGSNGIDDLFAT